MEKSITELRKEITRNGLLDTNDVDIIQQWLFDDTGITRRKADFLFELKDTVSREKMHPSFKPLFVESISILMLDDEDSPGEIDESEANWLRARIQSKGYMDDIDEELLKKLRLRSINYPSILNYKGKLYRTFENILYFQRFLTILAVVGSIISAIALFIKGTMVVINGLITFCTTFTDDMDYEPLLADFVSSVDIYLFAMVLIIFGMGIYELFINKIDPVARNNASRPSWLQVSSIEDLKSSLGKVILMAMIVSFFKFTLRIQPGNGVDLLYLAIGILLIAIALVVVQTKKTNRSPEKQIED